jgi:uncharacterized protein YoxC
VNWQVFFIGVTAVSVLIIAIGQVVLALALAKTARKISASVDQLRGDVRPLLDKVNRIADDAGRVAQLAVVQVERVDQLLASTSARVDETLGLLQSVVGRPVKQGAAIVAAVRAALEALRSWQSRPSAGHDDEDPLFVG